MARHRTLRPLFTPRSFTAADFRPRPGALAGTIPPHAAAPSLTTARAALAPQLSAPVAAPAASYVVPPGFMLVPTALALPPAPTLAPAPAPAAASPQLDRVRAILNHAEAGGREALAKHLALESDLSAPEAVARLAASPRTPAGPVASAMAGASIARAALGLAPDEGVDLAVARGVAAALGGPLSVDAAASARFAAEMAEGERTARALLGRG